MFSFRTLFFSQHYIYSGINIDIEWFSRGTPHWLTCLSLIFDLFAKVIQRYIESHSKENLWIPDSPKKYHNRVSPSSSLCTPITVCLLFNTAKLLVSKKNLLPDCLQDLNLASSLSGEVRTSSKLYLITGWSWLMLYQCSEGDTYTKHIELSFFLYKLITQDKDFLIILVGYIINT